MKSKNILKYFIIRLFFNKSLQKLSVLISEQKKDGNFLLKNQFIEALVNPEGCLVTLILLECHKDAVAPGCVGNRFVIYDDIPLYWDAWDVMDYHLETGRNGIKEVYVT